MRLSSFVCTADKCLYTVGNLRDLMLSRKRKKREKKRKKYAVTKRFGRGLQRKFIPALGHRCNKIPSQPYFVRLPADAHPVPPAPSPLTPVHVAGGVSANSAAVAAVVSNLGVRSLILLFIVLYLLDVLTLGNITKLFSVFQN